MSNSDNPHKGAVFQDDVMHWFIDHYKQQFLKEQKIKIGSPLVDISEYKDHKFDIVSEDNTIAIECKCYTWTESGNVPSAKMGFTNEAAFYLSLLPNTYKKYIVMLESYNSKKEEYLADYYYRMNRHLLGNIVIAEYNPKNKTMRFLSLKNEYDRINEFSNKYLKLYKDDRTKEDDICRTFADECFDLGFQMDCEKQFVEKYGAESANSADAFICIRESICDVDVLASEIFSKWRYITHWSYGERCLDSNNRSWFIAAFERLIELT